MHVKKYNKQMMHNIQRNIKIKYNNTRRKRNVHIENFTQTYCTLQFTCTERNKIIKNLCTITFYEFSRTKNESFQITLSPFTYTLYKRHSNSDV